MRHVLTILTCAALTLWLGGLVALFVFVQMLFNTDRATAANAAPILFRAFEIYQLALFVVAIVALVAWRLIACSRAKKWMTALVVLAGLLAVVQTAAVSSRMRAMVSGEERGGEAFRRLHAWSMVLYTGETVLLAAAACLLPAAITADARRFGPAPIIPTWSSPPNPPPGASPRNPTG
jgi:hypothetical protein